MEFAEVLKQWKRACAGHEGCAFCSLKDACGNTPSMHKSIELEKAILHWSTTHPEPRYPTWAEWWATLPEGTTSISINRAPITRYNMSPRLLMCDLDGPAPKAFDVNSSIPSDLAERLGIKPTNTAKE